MQYSNSSLPFNLEQYSFLSLAPVDSSNDQLIKVLYNSRNSDFLSCAYLMSRPAGQSYLAIKQMIAKHEHSDDFYYYIQHSTVDKPDVQSSLISGVIQAVWKDKSSGIVEVGITVFSDFRGRGIGGKSLDLLISRLSTHFNVFKFVASILTCNSPSRQLFLSRGFTQCGCHKQHFLNNGVRYDVDLYELIV